MNYDVSDGDIFLTGLGIMIYYDSSKLKYLNFDNFLNSGDMRSEPQLIDDINNDDGDDKTDKVLQMSWTSFSGNCQMLVY